MAASLATKKVKSSLEKGKKGKGSELEAKIFA